VLLLPVLTALLLGVPGVALLIWSLLARDAKGVALGSSVISPQGMAIAGGVLLVVGFFVFAYGVAKRNATEMAVTNRRVLIKTGMLSRRTLDLMLARVESIGVEETALGRMLGYGSVIVRGTGGTPESFLMMARPQEFRRAVQEQIGAR
jgi:uncharacterized membrane protein YdbT with pleckstrin-like domain